MKSNDAVASLSALAQEHRLEVFRLLVRAGRDGLPPSQIVERLNLSAPTLSFHLAQLKHAGLVQVRRDGRSLIYTVNYERMNGLMAFLADNCCAGDRPYLRLPVCVPEAAKPARRQAGRAARR